ncbi:recombinase family protein [Halothece sp. PCC 7418]|uniref:recombinase family protein n=1 Tax=Halothece sp. (strain PCC 7418) TaxID=65093 RepID=UPI0037BFA175
MDRLLRGDQFILVVACRDRLLRFGFELIEYMVQSNGGKIVVLEQSVHCPESELTADLLSIIHVFSCRMHGLRKYAKKIKQDQDIPK